MLIGQFHTKLTNKDRIAVPVKFRAILGKNLIVCRWYEKSLSIFSPSSWNKVLDLAIGESLLTAPARETERFLLGGAWEIELDNQGRFVLPRELKSYAQIEKEMVFLGLGDRVEIWEANLWRKKDEEIVERAEELIKEVQETKISNIKGVRS